MEEVVAAYLAAADTEAPGLVEGLYLEGSTALGEFRPRVSDIDFVAITATPPEGAALAALGRTHARLRDRYRRPFLDGVYLTWDDLRTGPESIETRPGVTHGRLGSVPVTPVTWHTLASYGLTCRGPAKPEIWRDDRALAHWTDANLDSYWRRLHTRASRPLSLRSAAALTPYATVWTATGVTRLHYTLATGDITSKESAARYGLEIFPDRWHRLLEEALRIRRASPTSTERSRYRTPMARRRDLLAYAEMVIADGHRLYARRWSGQVPGVTIRAMRPEDATEVLAIYQAGLDGGHASFETTAPTWETFDKTRLPEHRHVAVDTTTGQVLGWTAVTPVSSRCVYAGVVEHSVYVSPEAAGRGIGTELLKALIESTETAGVWTIQSGVFPENTASLSLHTRLGFRIVGTRRQVGRHHNTWRDVTLIERRSPKVT
ncbi:hypothetical protein GCM10009677_04060 [Sphaerisporangium rubeum]